MNFKAQNSIPTCILRTAYTVKPSANESQKTRNKKHETKRFSTAAVYHLSHSETKYIVSRNNQPVSMFLFMGKRCR